MQGLLPRDLRNSISEVHAQSRQLPEVWTALRGLDQPLVFINPVIVASQGTQTYQEGCLSVPGIYADVERAERIIVICVGLANGLLVTRARIGFVLEAETPLRLTPTAEAEAVTKLAAGEPGRMVRGRGNYVLIQTRRASGWVAREKFVLTCPE